MASAVGRPASRDTRYPIVGMMVYCSAAPSITSPGIFSTPVKSCKASTLG